MISLKCKWDFLIKSDKYSRDAPKWKLLAETEQNETLVRILNTVRIVHMDNV